MGLNVARLRVGVFAVASGESHTHASVSRSARPRFEIVVARALAGSRSGLSGAPAGGTLGRQRGRAGSGWKRALVVVTGPFIKFLLHNHFINIK